MNFKQIESAVKLSQNLNFSETARLLNISQPALSKQILSLEEELGVRLFDRSSNPLKITPAGVHFVQEAKKLMYSEEQLLRSMDDFAEGKRGTLTIGISPFRSLYLVSDMIRKLRESYPGLKIVLRETNSVDLHKQSVEGKFDLAIMNLPVDETLLDVFPLEQEQRVLAVPDAMAKSLPSMTASDGIREIDLSRCAELPFVACQSGTEMRTLFDALCEAAGITPYVTTEVVGITTAWSLARAGIGATILPLPFLKSHSFSDGLTIYRLTQTTAKKQPVVVMRKDQYHSEYAKKALELLTADIL